MDFPAGSFDAFGARIARIEQDMLEGTGHALEYIITHDEKRFPRKKKTMACDWHVPACWS